MERKDQTVIVSDQDRPCVLCWCCSQLLLTIWLSLNTLKLPVLCCCHDEVCASVSVIWCEAKHACVGVCALVCTLRVLTVMICCNAMHVCASSCAHEEGICSWLFAARQSMYVLLLVCLTNTVYAHGHLL